jgi:ABC-type polysaccharide/polyol phosphate export permease
MNKIREIYGLASIFSLISGMCIYLLFRDMSNMILFAWLQKTNINKNVFVPLESFVFANILQYNLPDMLWFVSGILFLRFIWFYRLKEQKVYTSCFYAFGIIFEISQLAKKTPGTFDLMDLFFMGTGAFIESLIYKIFVKRRFA